MDDFLSLVEEGVPSFCIQVVPPQDAEAIREALGELVVHLDACLGRPTVWFERDRNDLPPVRLVLNLCCERKLGTEVFETRVTADAVELRASTVRGMEHAVHVFLETAFGVRWLWPGETGAVTPRATSVRLPLGTRTHAPDWRWRRLWIGGAFWQEDDLTLAELKHGCRKPATLKALDRWQWRNRMGGLHIADGHRWAQICSPLEYGATHPEYFALVAGRREIDYCDGKHGNQPCTSNPDVIRLTADYIKAQFRARPDLDGFSLAANDGRRFCECPECRAIDEWAGVRELEQGAFDAATTEGRTELDAAAESTAITDRMLLFANQVVEQVIQEFPDKVLITLIYGPYRVPPLRVTLHPNVIAQFCTMTFSHAEGAVFRKETDILNGLGAFTTKRGIYDYTVNGANGTFPRGMARTFERSLREYYERGCRYFATQAGLDFATNGFTYYVLARQLWDRSESVNTILKDFCTAGFGPAAGDVCSYLAAFMDRWDETRGGRALAADRMERQAPQLYPQDWRAARRAELDRARRATEPDAPERGRIEFLQAGLEFLDLFVDACEALTVLVDRGFPERSPEAAGLRDARQKKQRLLEWVDAHRDGFWIAVTWFEYQRSMRRGWLGLDLSDAAAYDGDGGGEQ